MAIIEIKRNIFEKRPPTGIWGADWTKGFDSNDFIPGTVLFDPYINSRAAFLLDDILITNHHQPHQPTIIDHNNYLRLCQELKRDESMVSFYVAGALLAHNEGSKFGDRRILVASPVVIDGLRFQGNEALLPYFLLEQELELARVLPILDSLGSVNDSELNMIRQTAKQAVMETALYNGVLPQYLEFHDYLYPGDSDNPNVIKQFEMRKLAEDNVIAKYTNTLSTISNGLLSIVGKGNSLSENLKKVQNKKGFKPLLLNKKSRP
jgi:hypothetical protein